MYLLNTELHLKYTTQFNVDKYIYCNDQDIGKYIRYQQIFLHPVCDTVGKKRRD